MKLLFFSFSCFMLAVSAIEEFFGTQVFLDNKIVSEETTLNFILQMPSATVKDRDVLTIRLPKDENNLGYRFVSGRAFCDIQSPLSVRKCNIISFYEASMTFGVTSSAQNEKKLEGSLSYFKNPDSTQELNGIQFELADENGNLKAAFYSGELNFFQPTTVDATLSSSSKIVGDTKATLTVTVIPKYILAGVGNIQISIPEYYSNAGSHYMISTTSPTCSAQSTITVTSCVFDKQSRLLHLYYEFNNGVNSYQAATFYIENCFNNPIEPKNKAGFYVSTSDREGVSIAQSASLTLSGITTPNKFAYITFNLDRGTNVVGEMNALQMTIGQNLPLVDSCFIKFVFPEQFTLDSNLYEATGNSFFIQRGSGSSLVPFYSIDRANRVVVVKACEQYNGQNNIGTITFTSVKNPLFVIGTDSFEITMALDENFKQVIATQSTGITISESMWQAGTIRSGSVTSTNALVSAQAKLVFTFTPPTQIKITTGSKILVGFSTQLSINSCSISDRSSFINERASCSVNRNQIEIKNAFSREFPGGQAISFTLGSFTNPLSVRDVGDFTIQTFVEFEGARLVDSVTLTKQITTQAGLIKPKAFTEVSSFETYDSDGIYIFKLSFQHTTPRGSTIKVYLPTGMSIGNPTALRSNCYRLDKTVEPQKLGCSIESVTEGFTIEVDSVFGSNGLPANEDFRLQVSGIRNPRVALKEFMFYFESLDSLGYVIDQSRDDQMFAVAMTDIGQLQLISAGMDNQTNGATTKYNLRIYPNTPLENGDRLTFNLPDELRLPTKSVLSCGKSRNIRRMFCTTQGVNKKIQVVFEVVDLIGTGEPFTIFINEVINAPSLRPTSSFSNFMLTDENLYQIADYSGIVSVTNTEVGYIKEYKLIQGTKEPGIETDYTIRFKTNNDLPYSTAMIVRIPTEVTLIKMKGDCYVQTDRVQTNVCQFQGEKMIRIINAFGDQRNSYSGIVEINFRAKNPPTNEELKITLQLDIYDDSSFDYLIDLIVDGLSPVFHCNYPCQTCDYRNPDYCLSCPQGKNEPNFLQVGENEQTCENQCRPGFTYDILSADKICTRCHRSCKTCRIGVDVNDWEICTECADDYPYFWADTGKCYSKDQKCPVGTYEKEKYECVACYGPCQECRYLYNCTLCKPESRFPLLQNDRCVKECALGMTPVYTASGKGECVPCELPCGTCYDGFPAKCLTCAEGDRQFKFGAQCVAQCPLGTAIDIDAKECVGCRETCEQCSIEDNSICLKCKEGLALLKNECYAECPIEYLKSSDGKTCELRTYPFNKYYVPFPFLMLLTLMFMIIAASYVISKKATLIFQNMMVATSIILVVAICAQVLLAVLEGNQPLTIVFCVSVLLANLIINLAYAITFKLQIDDYRFNQYMSYHFYAYKVVTILNIAVSLHTFRLCYGKLFALPIFHAATTSPGKFYKPLLLYSLIQISCVCAPVCLANIFFAVMNRSLHVTDNQLQCTTVELIIISLLLIGLVVYERYFQHPKYINFRPDHDAVHVFQSVFGNTKGAGMLGEGDLKNEQPKKQPGKTGGKLDQVQVAADLDESSRAPLVEDKLDRHRELRQVLGLVRGKKDTCLNVSLDVIMNDEIKPQIKKQDSQPSLRLKQLWETDSDGQKPFNYSWEGAVPQWESDGASKRLELLTYMEKQLQLAAEKERIEAEKRELETRFQEKEQMYDNQMFDNVFFSAKTKRDNEAQAVTLLQEMEAQCSDRSDVQNFRTLLKQNEDKCDEAERKAQAKAEKRKAKADRQRAKQIQTDTVEFKSMVSQQRSLSSVQKGDSAAEQSSEESSSEMTQQVSSKKELQSSKYVSKKQKSLSKSVSRSVTKKSKSEKPVEQHQAVETSCKSQTSQISKFEDSALYSEQPHSVKEHVMLSQDDVLQGDEVSNMIGKDDSIKLKSLQEPQKVDEKNPGPETVKWIKRVKLMKTLMLDERDPATRPGHNIKLEEGGSATDRTGGGVKEATKQEANIVEELQDSDQCASKDDAIDEDSISTIGDDMFKNEAKDNAWEKDNAAVNQRNFNVFCCLGNFPLDKEGRIINRAQILNEMNYRDFDGLPVNNRGYLINETTGAIYSKYSFEDLFMPMTGNADDYGEIPMPYRYERFNFNPHSVMGNFDFDAKSRKPIFLKNKFGMLTDKNYRPVNKCGFLINEQEDVVDDNGEVKLAKGMLTEQGDLPLLYNYSGTQYKITDIIGQLHKDNDSKELLIRIDKQNNKAIDELGRPVNANGYLIDSQGNIINYKQERIWNFWELLYQEPPKIFQFTQWSLDWIRGNLVKGRELKFEENQDQLYDLDHRMINIEGYLIDKGENVIDKYGRIVFKNDLLTLRKGQDAKIPLVFTSGILSKPETSRLLSSPTPVTPAKDVQTLQTSENKPRTGGATSIFNIQDSDSINASIRKKSNVDLPPVKQKNKKEKKVKPAFRRQNSEAIQRPGTKIKNYYQQFLDGASDNNYSANQVQTISGQQIQPVLSHTPQQIQRYRSNSRVDNSSNLLNQTHQDSSEKMRLRHNSTQRLQQRNPMQQPFASAANIAIGMSKTPTNGLIAPSKPRVNQLVRDPSPPVPMPRANASRVPDNSYQARAEEIFRERQLHSQGLTSEPEYVSGLNFYQQQQMRDSVTESKVNISRQLEEVTSIYGRGRKKRGQQ